MAKIFRDTCWVDAVRRFPRARKCSSMLIAYASAHRGRIGDQRRCWSVSVNNCTQQLPITHDITRGNMLRGKAVSRLNRPFLIFKNGIHVQTRIRIHVFWRSFRHVNRRGLGLFTKDLQIFYIIVPPVPPLLFGFIGEVAVAAPPPGCRV